MIMREISLHILDIAQNSISAEASLIKITVCESVKENKLTVTVSDNGKGMSDKMVEKVVDPFTTGRRTRKVGLGIPLIKQAAELTGGNFSLTSTLGKGTDLTAVFVLDSIDRQPLGNMADTILGLITSHEKVDFLYLHKTDKNEFSLDTREIKRVLGGISLSLPDVYTWLSECLKEGEAELK